MIKIWQVYIFIPINAQQEVNKCLATKFFWNVAYNNNHWYKHTRIRTCKHHTHTHTQVHTRALLLCYFHCSVRKKATTS